ncbi:MULTISPECIES: hypothetical protein [Bacillus cereus group]|uniref:Uncharacterized protein n=1 Tax=Bacillus thuringiensis serovar mexicanensis TaxID=180868 RepID=A0A2C9YH96_BACTU|nr:MULTISPECIES: hypothetical protein [Bacillus cereus group]MEB9674047.1 hypothetical protein [Bacillus anthracis]OTW52666.1 hypothetical protein BK699_05835 [Bacillus thuringiensis serovar mexicanensis]OTX09972.1 hypothetical protein BK705_03710 [Bacillus thuringiensis serovar monterrey]
MKKEFNVLPVERVNELRKFVCYERTYNYFLQEICSLFNSSILYFDRISGFKYYENQQEPLQPINNYFKDFITKNSKEEEWDIDIFVKEKFIQNLKSAYINTVIEAENSKGENIYTSVLIEEIDRECIYYTKISKAWNCVRFPVEIDDFLKKIVVDNNTFTVEILREAEEIKEYKKLNKVELLKRIMTVERLQRMSNSSPSELYMFINEHEKNLLNNSYFTQIKKEKSLQLRVLKHLLNKVYPILIFLAEYIPVAFNVKNIEICHTKLESCLSNTYKWGSFFLGTARKDFYEQYIKSLKVLEEVLVEIHKICILDLEKVVLKNGR